MKIPDDPVILYSWINTMLRDRYASFSELCDDLELDEQAIKEKLMSAGFTYEETLNQFR